MASFPTRLISLAMVFALSGSPAVLAVCMTLCQQDIAAAGSQGSAGGDGHARHVSGPAPEAATAHAHHGSPAASEPAVEAPATVSPHPAAAARLSAPCSNCCPEGQLAFETGPGVARAGDMAPGASPMASRVASFTLVSSALAALPPSPPVPPPSPTRAPLVLRI